MSEIEVATFREVLGHFASGVSIVTALEDGRPVGFTCQAFCALSLDPAMILLAPARSSTSWPRMIEAGYFCVNILEQRQEALCRNFAQSGGEKFEGVQWSKGTTGAPVIGGSLAAIECRLSEIYDGGDHEIVTGFVVATKVGVGEPLLYYRSGFGGFTS